MSFYSIDLQRDGDYNIAEKKEGGAIRGLIPVDCRWGILIYHSPASQHLTKGMWNLIIPIS